MATNPSVADYLIGRLTALGIEHAFGVPGDYAFPLDDAIERHPGLQWVANANELNAAYAADGYARERGAAIICTTYAVGELSALNGVMGSRAERVPVFHLVGAPSMRLQRGRAKTHHSFGDGAFGQFIELSAAAACAHATLTPENAIAEIERVITAALLNSQPGYFCVPEDYALMPVHGELLAGRTLAETAVAYSDPNELSAAIHAIQHLLAGAHRPAALVTSTVARLNLRRETRTLLDHACIPYATTRMDKGTLSETHPQFLGMYDGAASTAVVRDAIEQADLVIDIGGVILSDYNSGTFSAALDAAVTVTLGLDFVRVGDDTYGPCALADVVRELTAVIPTFAPHERVVTAATPVPSPTNSSDDGAVTTAAFYRRLQQFLGRGDIVVTDTGVCVGPMTSLQLPADATFQYQTLWGSIGWATPAAFGAALACPDRRVILVTGDGGHQMTATELGTMGRLGVTPVIFVLNNGIYAIEEILSGSPGRAYDDLTPWRYSELPHALGCRDWHTARVETVADLDRAFAVAAEGGRGVYLEVVLDPADRPADYGDDAIERLYAASRSDA